VRREGRDAMASKEILNTLGRTWQATWLCLSLLTVAGCVKDAAVFSGLKPDHPPPLMAGCSTVTVFQPALRWQAFSPAEPEGSLSEATYEVRIWAAAHDAPGQLVYAREGLPEPSHKVQDPLPPSTTFFWSVRARFLLNGSPRVTDWGQQLAISIQVRNSKPGEWLGHDLIEHQYYRYYCFQTPGAAQ